MNASDALDRTKNELETALLLIKEVKSFLFVEKRVSLSCMEVV